VAVKQDPAKKLRRLLRRPSTDLLWYRRVGRCLHALNLQATYGSGRIRDLARELGQSHSTFYRAIQLAQAYPGDKIKALKGLRFSAVQVLLGVKDEPLRQQLQQEAVQFGWTYRRLQKEVDRRRGKQPARGGRRRKPAAITDDLAELAKRSKAVRQFVQAVWPKDRLDELRQGAPELARHVRRIGTLVQVLIESIERHLQEEPAF
jgi:hypothetical protein